ncbi:MAG TPA: aminomethyl-transferring glycine dehydrogenase [Streptosporangiaceae bacterium]|nr:aminomethyl-transferring glycine dehydrogenase [Streptosporangiaceae bacterium]
MEFSQRHIGPAEAAQARMLKAVGYESLDDLTRAALPGGLASAELSLPEALSEAEALAELRRLASLNTVATSMIGLGYYGTHTPAVIRRNVLENPAWYTAYTPYQPEISQGRLEALLNFQTMIEDLTGLPVAGASMLDEATAAAEAMTLARRARGKGSVFLADSDCLPQTLAVLATRAEPLGITLVTGRVTPELIAAQPDGELFGVLLQYPGASGAVHDLGPAIAAAHDAGALAAVAADLLAMTLLTPPGELGADIAVGSTQRFGVPMAYGGPQAGYICVQDALKRQLPGRLVGVSVDADGHPAYRLALQAREQHIRREKATSNICTAQVLLAVIAAMYAAYHGPDGLVSIAREVHRKAVRFARAMSDLGYETPATDFFDTVRLIMPGQAAAAAARAADAGINVYLADGDTVGVAVDETTTDEQLTAVASALAGRPVTLPAESSLAGAAETWPAGLTRTSPFLVHPVFHRHHSETAMLRYLRRLADQDIALDRSMIPLGSCTMKLNAAAEMEAISWPEFAGLHPFAPAGQAAGYQQLMGELAAALIEITGYDAVSLQPNAGSQGELAGLLAIRAYHRSAGQPGRTVCLIPESAHGTNAASAVLAGLSVVVVKCGTDGAIDLGDLHAKLAAHEGAVAAIMVTYPSTNGVFEETISAVCTAVHEAGGQVYVDGANLNALVGLAKPGKFGADVSHLNLHKTFCIPHGGGGPGVCPVAARAHLAPFLPGPAFPAGSAHGQAVAAAPYGSAGILPISWAYVKMMGAAGLRRATQVAILSANYVARRLTEHYPVLYTGRDGLVAHECILDLRPITAQTGITAEDVAKRLIDYGFHAPTMSFPVAGTLMVEPTESEDLAELDRFCDAMIAIRHEIDLVAVGDYDAADNPLKNAPHTASMLISGDWKHAYDRETAAYPAGGDRRGKYWPPVRRIDQAYGDRNLMCACPPPEAFEG